MKQGIYIVVSPTEIVKAEMERPRKWEVFTINVCAGDISESEWNYCVKFKDHILSLPRIAIQGKHNWKVWQEVEEGKEFRIEIDAPFPEIAIPIQPTPEGEKVEDKKTFFEWLNNNRLFFVDEVRGWLKMVDSGDISFSKFVELFNEKVFKSGYAAAQQSGDGWVKIEDGKPESGRNILIWHSQFGIGIGYFIAIDNSFGGTFHGIAHIDNDNKVTHWMSLPPPPSNPITNDSYKRRIKEKV